ncbi:hypothetical protein EW145_g1582 [Phellinidium pouzarii]|uniref:ER membrane protein complex subunit 10 n=1 Tax=Phellinidium pouzarii TaxID=167371 RepID=A0A4S4LE09_9AGAM|nr:hypothetical protein EW145_g1582 [Phellinidium pouzarii]
MLVLFALLLSPLLVGAHDDGTLTLLHRVLVPTMEENQPFVPRADIDVATRQLKPVPHFNSDLVQFYRDAKAHNTALYQIALQTTPADDPANVRLDISSVMACHLPMASADFLSLHLDNDGSPFHVDYYLADVPLAGACPANRQLRAVNLDQVSLLPPSNTTVRVQHTTHPPLPELRVPPPLTPKGEVIAPVPEKSFVQKYWMYIVAALVMLLFAGGSPPQEETAGGNR